MDKQILTRDELDALPVGTVLRIGDALFLRMSMMDEGDVVWRVMRPVEGATGFHYSSSLAGIEIAGLFDLGEQSRGVIMAVNRELEATGNRHLDARCDEFAKWLMGKICGE